MASKEELETRPSKFQKLEYRRRVLVVVMIIPAVIGAILLFIGMLYDVSIYTLFALIGLGLTGIMSLMAYLQTGFKTTQDESATLRYEREFSELLNLRNQLAHREKVLSTQIEILKEEIAVINSKIKETPEIVDEDQKQDLIAQLKEQLTAATATEVLEEIKEQANRRFAVEARIRQVSAEFEGSVRRLNAEVSAQGRRGNLNLVLGILTTISGLVILGYFVIKLEPSKAEANYVDFVRHFTPRLSLVVFIELFAYFFLRLYKASLAEIKYFQNELTNVESKAIALGAALNTQEESTISDAIISLANTERNRILQKGETTPELESAKIEAGSISDIAKEVVALVKKHRE